MALRSYLQGLWDDAEADYRERLLDAADPDPAAVLLDLGCDDGAWTSRVARKIGAARILGVDVENDRSRGAGANGVEVRFGDLNDRFPITDGEVDVVHSNQVIEHVGDLDQFVSETFRVLRPGGYALICTENLASWHNVASLVLGLQPFSLTNVSITGTLGNPFGFHAGVAPGIGMHQYKSFFHTRVLAYRAFSEIFERFGFRIERIGGTGYHPLPGTVARRISRLDPAHSHFIYLKARKPAEA